MVSTKHRGERRKIISGELIITSTYSGVYISLDRHDLMVCNSTKIFFRIFNFKLTHTQIELQTQ